MRYPSRIRFRSSGSTSTLMDAVATDALHGGSIVHWLVAAVFHLTAAFTSSIHNLWKRRRLCLFARRGGRPVRRRSFARYQPFLLSWMADFAILMNEKRTNRRTENASHVPLRSMNQLQISIRKELPPVRIHKMRTPKRLRQHVVSATRNKVTMRGQKVDLTPRFPLTFLACITWFLRLVYRFDANPSNKHSQRTKSLLDFKAITNLP